MSVKSATRARPRAVAHARHQRAQTPAETLLLPRPHLRPSTPPTYSYASDRRSYRSHAADQAWPTRSLSTPGTARAGAASGPVAPRPFHQPCRDRTPVVRAVALEYCSIIRCSVHCAYIPACRGVDLGRRWRIRHGRVWFHERLFNTHTVNDFPMFSQLAISNPKEVKADR